MNDCVCTETGARNCPVHNEAREWILPLTELVTYNVMGLSTWSRQDLEEEIHVIEFSAYLEMKERAERAEQILASHKLYEDYQNEIDELKAECERFKNGWLNAEKENRKLRHNLGVDDRIYDDVVKERDELKADLAKARKENEELIGIEGAGFYARVQEFEHKLLRLALNRTNGNKSHAADLLRMNRTTFHEKCRKAGIV